MTRSVERSSSRGGAERFTALMGLAAVVAWVVGFALASGPSVASPAAQLSAYSVDHHARFLVCLLLFEAGAALLIGFFVGLWHLLGEADESVGPLAATGAMGGIATQVLVIAAMAVGVLGVLTAMRGGPPETVKTLDQGLWVIAAASAVPTVVFATAFGLAMLRTGVPGRWAGWLALAVAAFHVLAALGLAQSGTLAMDGLLANLAPLVFLAWVVATSVPLLRRAGARSGSAGRAPDDAVHPVT